MQLSHWLSLTRMSANNPLLKAKNKQFFQPKHLCHQRVHTQNKKNASHQRIIKIESKDSPRFRTSSAGPWCRPPWIYSSDHSILVSNRWFHSWSRSAETPWWRSAPTTTARSTKPSIFSARGVPWDPRTWRFQPPFYTSFELWRFSVRPNGRGTRKSPPCWPWSVHSLGGKCDKEIIFSSACSRLGRLKAGHRLPYEEETCCFNATDTTGCNHNSC